VKAEADAGGRKAHGEFGWTVFKKGNIKEREPLYEKNQKRGGMRLG